ncbi:hypothetical protein SERLA73DRAFT_124207 [Serpula lacrymans var. lacrymans S7.3]|uniref:LIM zinc-binding domain-containing protein n=1 Tax=Serpula lacrymans var. lacrymans (strain S7.3) TaxID=936435 RepID=F8Q2W2_SERL3|nr:hypothetical protein SERLA73DRAFT_124207 [Serpula lacrymans var. lacrymans S7.3]
MGFCRRCGDIVSGPRCKCGGTAVAPVVSWSPSKDTSVDKWSQTYTARDSSPTRSQARVLDDPADPKLDSPSNPNPRLSSPPVTNPRLTSSSDPNPRLPPSRFPRPNAPSTPSSTINLSHRVSAHISSTTRPPSPLKQSVSLPPSSPDLHPPSPSYASLAANILPSPYAPTLSKVYGSVLQPKESLASFSCALCSSEFPPDATIYPDPSSSSLSGSTSSIHTTDRFLCRPCFIENGGSKGQCPTCQRPVLILKSEGGFIENSGRVWHKRCFRCQSCYKNIGDTPMVDLLGHPSCADCFDSCLKRDKTTPRKTRESDLEFTRGERDRLHGGLGDVRSREGSPALEELEQRLGILKDRDGSPAIDELTRRLSVVLNRTPTKDSPAPATSKRGRRSENEGQGSANSLAQRSHDRFSTPDSRHDSPKRLFSPESTSPVRYGAPAVGRPSLDAIEEMKRRFLRQSLSADDIVSPPPSSSSTLPSPLPHSASSPVTFKSPTPQKVASRIPVAKRLSGSPVQRSRDSTSSVTSSRDRDSWIPATPDLTSEFSDATTLSSGPSSPPAFNSPGFRDDVFVHGSGGRGGERRRSRGEDVGYGGISKFDIPPVQALKPSITGQSLKSSYTGQSVKPSFTGQSIKSNHTGQPLKPSYTGQSLKPSHTGQSLKPSHTGQSLKPFHTGQSQTQPLKPALTGQPLRAATLSTDSLCAKCGGALFASQAGGRFVTVPEVSATGYGTPKTYHTECFRCVICDGPFRESGTGQAVFVRGEGGACHVDVGLSIDLVLKCWTRTSSSSVTPSSSNTNTISNRNSPKPHSSRYERPLAPPSAPAISTSFPRFGSSTACPGCRKNVSPMEMGVVPGPQGSRWHATCLVCGGKGAGKGRGKRKDEPGCGKRLDSAAKSDGEGGVWCRECLLLLPLSLRTPQVSAESPTKPLVPSFTGRSVGERTTTMARQFTGLGGADAALMRQLTGGGLSPTRQLTGSPTKMFGSGGGGREGGGFNVPGTPRPRPKSVIGMRSVGGGKSVDEGRGMFLVRQMTGGGGL